MLYLSIEKKWNTFHLQLQGQFDCKKITAIVGTSGAGKTTLIHLINGLLTPDNGRIQFNRQPLVDTRKKLFIPPDKRKMATIFQDALLFPHLTVFKNLTYGQKRDPHPRFEEIIDVLNIHSLLHRYPATLSGGEKQRISIGRALLSDPKLLLMDEPLSALDVPRKKELLEYINRLTDEFAIPILYVTHHLYEAQQLASELMVLEQGQLHYYGDTKTILTHDYFLSWQ